MIYIYRHDKYSERHKYDKYSKRHDKYSERQAEGTHLITEDDPNTRCMSYDKYSDMINIQRDMINIQRDMINIQRAMTNIQREKQGGTHHITEGDPHTSGTSRWV